MTGQVRRVIRPSRRDMKRRAAVEPVIGNMTAEHRMDRNYLQGRDSDLANYALAAASATLHCRYTGCDGFCAPSSSLCSRRPLPRILLKIIS